MKRTLLIISLALTTLTLSATRRALVIGIGDYPASSGWAKINGDKDIPMVEEMLLANGFSKANIVELSNQQATCAAIKQQFENLIARSQSGDYIYIHFSGHGQQITDLNGDEKDGLDEALIPYDAMYEFTEGVYEGQNHLVDDQINNYLHRLRQSVGEEGQIVFVADACHSEDVTRSLVDDNVVVRGALTNFVIPNIDRTKRFLTKLFKKETKPTDHSNVEQPVTVPLEWIVISACKSGKGNQEYKGKGSLTTILYNNKDLLSKLSLESLRKRLKNFYDNPYNFKMTQVPVIESPTELSITVLF